MMDSYHLNSPRCQHVKDNGIRCGSPALRHQSFCYQHHRMHNRALHPGDKGYRIPALESPVSVTLAVVEVAQAVHDGKISLPLARTLLYAIQLGAPYASRATAPPAAYVTIDLPPAMQQSLVLCGADTPVREKPIPVADAPGPSTEIPLSASSINNNQSPINNSDPDSGHLQIEFTPVRKKPTLSTGPSGPSTTAPIPASSINNIQSPINNSDSPPAAQIKTRPLPPQRKRAIADLLHSSTG